MEETGKGRPAVSADKQVTEAAEDGLDNLSLPTHNRHPSLMDFLHHFPELLNTLACRLLGNIEGEEATGQQLAADSWEALEQLKRV